MPGSTVLIFCYPHSTVEETEAQRDRLTCQGSHSKGRQGTGAGHGPWPVLFPLLSLHGVYMQIWQMVGFLPFEVEKPCRCWWDIRQEGSLFPRELVLCLPQRTLRAVYFLKERQAALGSQQAQFCPASGGSVSAARRLLSSHGFLMHL